MGVSTGGKDTPASKGVQYGANTFTNSGEPELLFNIGDETGSVAIAAESGNGGTVYLGFDDSVSSSNGFPLSSGDVLTMDLDVSSQAVYGVAGTGGDGVRIISIR